MLGSWVLRPARVPSHLTHTLNGEHSALMFRSKLIFRALSVLTAPCPSFRLPTRAKRFGWVLAVVVITSFSAMPTLSPALAQQTKDSRPYDTQLYRLAEILGAVHYLRELCDAKEGQQWRDQMRGLLSSEGFSAVRRARLTRSFNNGYRSYSRTYVNCTNSAKSAITKFLAEGVELSESLIKPKKP